MYAIQSTIAMDFMLYKIKILLKIRIHRTYPRGKEGHRLELLEAQRHEECSEEEKTREEEDVRVVMGGVTPRVHKHPSHLAAHTRRHRRPVGRAVAAERLVQTGHGRHDDRSYRNGQCEYEPIGRVVTMYCIHTHT